MHLGATQKGQGSVLHGCNGPEVPVWQDWGAGEPQTCNVAAACLRILQCWDAPRLWEELCYTGGAGIHACIVGYCTTRTAGAVRIVLLILSGATGVPGLGCLLLGRPEGTGAF